MNLFFNLLDNYCLIAAFVSWITAQVIKSTIWVIQNRHFSFFSLVSSGGMPSSHSSTVCALATSIGLVCGFDAPIFAIAFILAFIVMYDAAGVRRAAGEQAKILNRMMEDINSGNTELMPKRLKELVGHTPLQVFAGALLGIVIALIQYLIVY